MTTRTNTPSTPTVHGGTPILADIRRRFGGIDTPAAIVGALTAIGVITFLLALLAAGSASIALQMDLIDAEGTLSDLDAAGFAAALAVVFVGFLVGGWAAGRMARYDGGKNGLAAAFWMLVFIVGFAAAGALIAEEYNALAATDLPDWMSQIAADDATTVGIVAAALAVVVMFLGGWIGGRLGETYHHRVDAAVAHAAGHPEPSRTDQGRPGQTQPELIATTPLSTDPDPEDLTVDDAGGRTTVLADDVAESDTAVTDDADVVDAEVVAVSTHEDGSDRDEGLDEPVVDAGGQTDDHEDAAGERDSTRFGVGAPPTTPSGATGPGRDQDTTPT